MCVYMYRESARTHTHTHIYIYIHMCVCVCYISLIEYHINKALFHIYSLTKATSWKYTCM